MTIRSDTILSTFFRIKVRFSCLGFRKATRARRVTINAEEPRSSLAENEPEPITAPAQVRSTAAEEPKVIR